MIATKMMVARISEERFVCAADAHEKLVGWYN